MIIEEIELKNFQCYYDTKTFRFSKGLNIILGKNGDGKTKFYEAIDWLFGRSSGDQENLISAKALDKLANGDDVQVSVRMTVNQEGERRTLRRSFFAVMQDDGTLDCKDIKLDGIIENSEGERSPYPGEAMKDLIFDSRIRQYSMFKGESELNVFDNRDALNNLIDLFSDTKKFAEYIDVIGSMLKKAEGAVSADAKKNKSNEKKYALLEGEIQHFEREREIAKLQISNLEKELDKLDSNIKQASNMVDNAEQLEVFNKRIAKKEHDILQLNKNIAMRETYTINLFDENWFLVHFEDIFSEYKEKVNAFSKERRKLLAKYNQELGRKEGEKLAKQKLMESIPLPIGTPSQAHMEEMINEELCKVCNREAPKGSEAYEYMAKRLKEFFDSQEIDKEEEQPKKLFKYNFVSKLNTRAEIHEQDIHSIRNISGDITDNLEFVQNRKRDLAEKEKELQEEIEGRSKLISSSTIDASSLGNILQNYNGFQKDRTENKDDLSRFQSELKKIESNLQEKLAAKKRIDKTQVNQFLLKTRDILSDIYDSAQLTKTREFNSFVDKLERLSNKLFKETNQGSFTGVIKFYKLTRSGEDFIDIRLVDSEGKKFNGNSAQVTLLHISVLLAISELVKEADNQSYPMIMDAPVSNFDEMHSKLFFEAMKNSVDQSILLLKDYVVRDDGGNLVVKDEFKNIPKDKAFWIKLEEPYENEKLSTINTQIIEL